ncbi:MAG: isopentenyl phosphate kinase [Methanomicrobiales archaeon]|nr:isopentenyl phosphate kinase [Methanomicrobiales archaeon]
MILKLGGSVVTSKGLSGAIDTRTIDAIAGEVARRPDVPLLLVHGAGSCGHPEAARYGITGGINANNRRGVGETHRAVRRLNDAVVTGLREHDVDAIGISPLGAYFIEDGDIVAATTEQLGVMIDLGIVPVLHGDVVMDRTRGASILSGDRLVRTLAPALGIQRVGLATDVAGVLSRDGEVIPNLTPGDLPSTTIKGSTFTDVTGGMAGKLSELVVLAREGVPSEIFHVSRIGDFLDGSPHGGTHIHGG